MQNMNQGTRVSFNSNSGQATYKFNVNQVTPDVVDWVHSHIEYYNSRNKRPFAEISPCGTFFTAKTLEASTRECIIKIRVAVESQQPYSVFENILTDAEMLAIQASKRKPQPFKGLKPLGRLVAVAQPQTESANEQSAEQTDQPAEQEVSSAQADLTGQEPEAFQ